MDPDGTKIIRSKYGRIHKGRGTALRLRKALNPICTHIMTNDGNIKQTTSGEAYWHLLPIATPSDVNDIIAKANTILAPNYITLATSGVNAGYQGRFNVYSHDTMFNVKNQHNNTVTITAYECVARENIVRVPSQNPISTPTNSIQSIFTMGWNKTNPTAAGNMTEDDVDSTLYQNPLWCHFFKITRARSFTLKPGENVKLNVQHGKAKCINALELGTNPEMLAFRGFTRVIVFKMVGGLTSIRTGWGVVSQGQDMPVVPRPAVGTEVDTSTISCDFRWVKKFRWNQMPWMGDMITQNDGDPPELATNLHEAAVNPVSGMMDAIPAEL